MSKNFFQSKNSNRSKQTTAKGKQIEFQEFSLFHHPKQFSHLKINAKALNFIAAQKFSFTIFYSEKIGLWSVFSEI